MRKQDQTANDKRSRHANQYRTSYFSTFLVNQYECVAGYADCDKCQTT